MTDSAAKDPSEDFDQDPPRARPRAQPGGGCFCTLLVFLMIAFVYISLGFEPLGLLWQLPSAILSGALITRSLGFTDRRRLVALGCALAIGITFLGGNPLMASANRGFEERLAAQQNPVFGMSRALHEWIEESDSGFVALAAIALPFIVVLDVLFLPFTLIVGATLVLELVPYALPAAGTGILLCLPGLVGLAVLNRRRLEEQAAFGLWEEHQDD